MSRPVLTAALVVFLAGCGGDAGGSATSVTTTAPSATTTAAVTTTTEAVTTTVTTTTSAADARVAAAQALAGRYEGEWVNTTFGSTGPMTLDVGLAGTVVTVVLDLGGTVFGGGDPDPITLTFDLAAAGPFAAQTDLFGDVTIGSDAAGTLVVEAPAVPGLGGIPMTMRVLGDGADGLSGEYVIPGLAEGTFTLQR